MAFNTEGTLTTDKRETAISETWDSQTEWEAYQSLTGIEISSGTLKLKELSVPSTGLLHQWDLQAQSSPDPLVDQFGSNDLTATNFSPTLETGINGNNSVTIPEGGSWYEGNSAPVGTNGEFTVAFIGRWTGPTGFEYGIMNGSNDTYASDQDVGGGDGYFFGVGGGDIRGGTPSADLHIYILTFDGSTGYFTRDGTVLFSGSLPTPQSPSGSLSVGGDYIDASGEEIELGEMLIYDSFYADSDRQDIITYFNDKWGTSI